MTESRTPHDRALPNYQNAVIPREKLERYSLDLKHESKAIGKSSGKDKARVFQAALGFGKADWELLKNRILEELPYEEATVGWADEYGKRYSVKVAITGPEWKYCYSLNSLDNKARNRFSVSHYGTCKLRLDMSLISSKQKAFEGDVVELLEDIPTFNAKLGQRGVVITTFDVPSEAYDLELLNELGDFEGFAYSIKPEQFSNLSRSAFSDQDEYRNGPHGSGQRVVVKRKG